MAINDDISFLAPDFGTGSAAESIQSPGEPRHGGLNLELFNEMKSSHQNMLTPVVHAAEMRKLGSVHSSINSSNDSMSPKRKKDSPNKKSLMGAFVPKDCAVDIDKAYIYSIGKDIFKNVASA